jgi:hypothetical protein
LNNDGNLDLFLNFDPSGVGAWIAYGHGDGTFGNNGGPDLYIPTPVDRGPVALGYLTGNGILDAVISDYNPSNGLTSNIYVLQQTSVADWVGLDGKFASTSSPGLSVNGPYTGRTFSIGQIAIGDINGDGNPDITLVEDPTDNGYGQTLTYFNQGTTNGLAGFNTNTGSFYFALLANGAKPDSMTLGDYNNDGQIDILLGDGTYNGGGVWLLTNQSQVVADPTLNVQANGQYTVNFANLQLGQVAGVAFADSARDGRRQPGAPGVPDITVFLDVDGNGKYDPGVDPVTTTNADGLYAFSGLSPQLTGIVLAQSLVTADLAASPAAGYPVELAAATHSTGLRRDFAIRARLLYPVADQTVAAGQTLTLTVSQTPDAHRRQSSTPSGPLVFLLDPGAPAGMTIDPLTGLLSWTPGENQAGGTYAVTVRVRDPYDPLHTDSRTFTLSVVASTTTTLLQAAPPLSVFGQDVTFTVAVSAVAPATGTPTGQVIFEDNGVPLGSAPLSNGVAGFTLSTLSVGSHSITAFYSGDATFAASTSNVVVLMVAPLLSGSGVAVNGFEFSPLSDVTVATFTAGDGSTPASAFSATIAWGDGSSSAGTITVAGGVYSVLGSHTYTDEGSYAIVVSLSGPGGAAASLSSSATLLEQLLPDGTRGDANQRYVSELYRDLLGRQVDPTGLGNLAPPLDSGVLSRAQVVAAITSSGEYQTDEVEQLYKHYLDRDVDPTGLSNALAALAAGETLEQVAAGIIGSPEFVNLHGRDTTVALNALYELALGRAIDSTGLSNASAALAVGMSLSDVALGVLTSDEYRSDLVNSYYLLFLDRSADAVGLANAVSALDHGASDAQIVAGLVTSDEYFNKTSA